MSRRASRSTRGPAPANVDIAGQADVHPAWHENCECDSVPIQVIDRDLLRIDAVGIAGRFTPNGLAWPEPGATSMHNRTASRKSDGMNGSIGRFSSGYG